MHTLDQNPNTSNVPAFIVKLWKLVEDEDCNDLISWSENGTSFILRHQATFARNLLPKYFKHNNMASFIRQLNMYGFRKVMNYEKGGLNVDNDEMEFIHPFFSKGSEGLLEFIKRKVPSKEAELSTNPKNILTDLTAIREKQESMNSMLSGMKKENELMWRELSSLRQKHKTQEQIIQKVIHFLVTIVQSSKQNMGVKRKITHMLQDGSATSAKRSRGLVDVVRGKKPDFFFSQVSDEDEDKATSPDGPVIREVTEFDHEDSLGFEGSLNSGGKRGKQKLAESIPQVDSPLSSSVSVASPADSLKLLEPVSTTTSMLPYAEVEEVLGLPFDHRLEEASDKDLGNVISIPDVPNRNGSIPQFLDLLISGHDETSNVIPLPDSYQLIPVAPDGTENISLMDNANPQNEGVIFSSSDVPLTPSTVAVLCSSLGLSNESSKPECFNVSDLKLPELEKNVSSPNIKTEDKLKSCLKSPPNQNSSKKNSLLTSKVENQENAGQNNFQLALSDASSSAEITNLIFNRTAIKNHLIGVDQEIDWLQGQLTNGIDSSMLLELFSSDDAANNAAQTCQLNTDDGVLRDDSNIIGNELVQFTPSILDIDFDDIGNPMLMDYLTEGAEESTEDANTSSVVKTPPIKQERNSGIPSSCFFENIGKASQTATSPRGRKNSRGRGKRKLK